MSTKYISLVHKIIPLLVSLRLITLDGSPHFGTIISAGF